MGRREGKGKGRWCMEVRNWAHGSGASGAARRTRLSPLSFVSVAGSPAGRACWKMSIWPRRAASNMREARATASGGREEAVGAAMLVRLGNES